MKIWFSPLVLSLVLTPNIIKAQTPVTPTIPAVTPAPVPTLTPASNPSESLPLSLIPLAGTDQIQLRLVNCNARFLWGIDCGLSQLLLPPSTRLNQWDLQFENPTASAVNIVMTAVIANGTLNPYQLTTQGAVTLPPGPQKLPAQPIVTLPLSFTRSAMPPNQYNGAVYLTLEGQTTRLLLPLDLRVRTGPTFPLLVVFFGIVLGRLFQYMQKQGGPLADALQEFYRLQRDIKEAHAEDQRLLFEMTRRARKLLDRQQIEAAIAQINAIRNRLDVLNQIRTMADDLQRRDDLPLDSLEECEQQMHIARAAIAQEKDTEAKAAIEMLSQLLMSLPQPRGVAEAEEPMLVDISSQASTTLEQNARSLAIPTEPPSVMASLQQLLIEVSGLADQVRTDATFWFVRPLLYLSLLAGLTIVGINTLYIEQGETFGATPLSDYMGLILWGLSADVASRTLSSLEGKND